MTAPKIEPAHEWEPKNISAEARDLIVAFGDAVQNAADVGSTPPMFFEHELIRQARQKALDARGALAAYIAKLEVPR